MKKQLRISALALALIVALTASTATGCKKETASSAASSTSSASSSSSEVSSSSSTASSGAAITDAGGRKVTLPSKISRVVSLHPIPAYLVWRFAPDKLVNVDMVFSMTYLKANSVPIFNPETIAKLKKLPVTGTYFKGFNQEQIAGLAPDVVFTMKGDSAADKMQKQLNTVYVEETKAPLDIYPSVFAQMSEILGNSAEAAKLSAFWNNTLQTLKSGASSISAANRKKVLYVGKGGDILATPTKGTIFSSDIDEAGAENLGDRLNMVNNESAAVNIEQIIKWNPDIIIVATQAGKAKIMASTDWQSLDAVKNGKVYVPRQFASLDGIQCIMGSLWTQGILLHQNDTAWQQNYDNTLKQYYQLFFDRTLTDTELHETATI